MKIKDKNAYSMPQAIAFDFAQEWHKEQHVLVNKLGNKFLQLHWKYTRNDYQSINSAQTFNAT